MPPRPPSGSESGLFVIVLANATANRFVVACKLRRGPNHLPDVVIGRLKLKGQFVEGYPGLRVHLRIVNRDREFQMVSVRAMESFFYTQIGAVRTADMIDPASLIDARGLHNESGVVRPLAHRISEPAWLSIFGEVPSVSPDYPPNLAKLIQNDRALRRL